MTFRSIATALIAVAVAATPVTVLAQTRGPTVDIARARELDAQGVRAYQGGHYRDAIRFFTEAYKLGGPSTEIWNIARCHQKLDEPDEAEAAFEKYLAQTDLDRDDRAEATSQLAELRKRPSILSIDSDPAGATVLVDGKKVAGTSAVTPTSVEIAPGKHKVHVEKADAGSYDVEVEARFGRAVLVQAKLSSGGGTGTATVGGTSTAGGGGEASSGGGETGDGSSGGSASMGSASPPGADHGASSGWFDPTHPKKISLSIELGYFLPKLGDDGQGLRPALHLAGRYAFLDDGKIIASAGVRFVATRYGGSPPDASPLCQLAQDYGTTELGAAAVGALAARLGRARIGGDLGVGVAALAGGDEGADAHDGNCSGTGVKAMGHLGTEVSFAVNPNVRLLLSPAVFQIHPGFDGARTAPNDTTGLWWRFGSSLGLAFDL